MSTISQGDYADPVWPLPQHEVHVWQANTRLAWQETLTMQQWLSSDEHLRVQKFYFEKDRHRFIVARGGLRKLLGLYLGTAPASIRFQYNQYGKPALDMPELSAAAHLCFNASHSREVILYAFGLDRTLGVDVEYMRVDIEHEALAESSFSLYEQQALRALPAQQKLQGFYNGWTRKEAYIKARGQGLSLPLSLFDVTLAPGQSAALLASREGPQEVARWSMHALTTEADYAGALTVEGHGWKLRYFVVDNFNNLNMKEQHI